MTNFKEQDLYFTCNYDEKSFDTYKGIVVKYLHYSDKVLDVINTGDVYKDLEIAYEKYKGHLIAKSSLIDNYCTDLMNGKELCSQECEDLKIKDKIIKQQSEEIQEYRSVLKKISMITTDRMLYQVWAEQALKNNDKGGSL